MMAAVHWEARRLQRRVNKLAEEEKIEKSEEAKKICARNKLQKFAGFEWLDEADNPFHERRWDEKIIYDNAIRKKCKKAKQVAIRTLESENKRPVPPQNPNDNNQFGMPEIYGSKRVGLPSQLTSIVPKDPELNRRYRSIDYLQQH